MYEIKRGAPPMDRKKGNKYPFAQMEVDTYFEIPSTDPGAQLTKDRCPRVASPAYAYGYRHGWVFSVRKLDSGAIRVYRVK